ncbi:MAG: hypothetical protein ACJA1U_000375 [Bermanella sp.]|jgi:hypothetical protein
MAFGRRFSSFEQTKGGLFYTREGAGSNKLAKQGDNPKKKGVESITFCNDF